MKTGMERALELIEICKEEKNTFLDLGNLGLTEVPEEVGELSWLEGLNLGWYYIDSDKLVFGQKLNFSTSRFRQNKINDISILSINKKLKKLFLNYNQINDVSKLQFSTYLTSLDLSNNQINDVSKLPLFNNLTSLDLSSNQINDVSKLPLFNNLTSLGLAGNQISDVSKLPLFNNLTFLNLINNQISDISKLPLFTNLTSLHLSNNQIDDVSKIPFFNNLTSLGLGGNQISDVSKLPLFTNLTSLNLNNNQISNVSKLPLFTNLNSLSLNNNQISNVSKLPLFINLTSLDLGSNPISDISKLPLFINLTYLDLSNNPISDISQLPLFSNLTSLVLNGNQISNISQLPLFPNLTSLELNSNQIGDISKLPLLTNLTSLKLSKNQISDISKLPLLINLTSLNLDNNQISDISKLPLLTNLTSLKLDNNQISDISKLSIFTNLTSLELAKNQINDITQLQTLSKITKLNLSSNKISNIKAIETLKEIKTLDLRNNRLESFPKKFLNFQKVKYLYISNNPIFDFPSEITNKHNCLQDARAWQADLQKGGKANNELKTIMLGNGRVGKTSVVTRLIDKNYIPNQASTHAIKIRMWEQRLKINKAKKKAKIRIWDFGGQDIYHSTHRIFMQSRALFVLVWDYKTENKQFTVSEIKDDEKHENFPLPYWIDYIRSLGRRSPVLIVQNRKDKDKIHTPAHKELLEGMLPNKILNYPVVNAEQDEGFKNLKEVMKAALEAMPELGMQMPTSWYNVRKEIFRLVEKLQKNETKKQRKKANIKEYLEYNEFEKICVDNEVSKNSVSSLLAYLHNTGWIFYQKNLFGNRIIVDQPWAIKAIYTLLDRKGKYFSLLSKNGRFDLVDLKAVWSKYNDDEIKLFISFMKNCELCFQTNKDEKNPEFIAPQLLTKTLKPITVTRIWEKSTDVRHFVYHHDYLHSAIIQRFMVRAGHLAESHNLWHNGIYFEYENTSVSIEVRKFDNNLLPQKGKTGECNVLWIQVSGAKKAELLSLIRQEFKKNSS